MQKERRHLLLRAFIVLAAVLTCIQAEASKRNVESLPAPEGEAVLEVKGAITATNADGAAIFDMNMLRALPRRKLETRTAVTDGVRRFDGFLMRDLLDRVGAKGTTLTAIALNDYVIDIDVGEFSRFDVLVAYEMDGEMLLPSDKGPLWIVYPRDQHPELQDIRYDYRWVWQLYRIEIE